MRLKEMYVKCKYCKTEIILARTLQNRMVYIEAKSLTDVDIDWLVSREDIHYNELIIFRAGEHTMHNLKCTGDEYDTSN